MLETKSRFSQTQNDEEMQQKLRQINSQMIRMKNSVMGGQGNANTKPLKLQIIEKLEQQYKSYEKLILGGDETERQLLGESRENNMKKNAQTLTDMRAQLLEEAEDQLSNTGKKSKSKNKNSLATQIELEKMKQWQRQNQAIDDEVDKIIDRTRQLKSGADRTGQLLNITDQKVKELTTDVDTVNNELVNANKKLKEIVEKFRKPHKFCIDIVLVVILIGLIIGIIKVASG